MPFHVLTTIVHADIDVPAWNLRLRQRAELNYRCREVGDDDANECDLIAPRRPNLFSTDTAGS